MYLNCTFFLYSLPPHGCPSHTCLWGNCHLLVGFSPTILILKASTLASSLECADKSWLVWSGLRTGRDGGEEGVSGRVHYPGPGWGGGGLARRRGAGVWAVAGGRGGRTVTPRGVQAAFTQEAQGVTTPAVQESRRFVTGSGSSESGMIDRTLLIIECAHQIQTWNQSCFRNTSLQI